jgi:capsular polysaccharide transport system permease protein
MDDADKAIGLRRLWSGSSADYFSRLSTSASEEEFYKYYSKHVTVISDPLDPVIQLQVDAFHGEDSQLIAKTLVGLAQEKLNSSFTAMREDSLQFARSEVSRAEQQLAGASDKLKAFRNSHSELDPTASAQGVGQVTTAMFGQLASAEAELRTTLSYARDDSSAVKNLKTRISSLKKQIADNRDMLAGTSNKDKPYSELMSSYEELMLNQKFAQEAYTSAMSFLAQSRTSLARQHSYLIDFLSPTLPQDALEPRSLRNIAIVLIASGLLWLTISLVGSALREHARR